MKKSLLLLSLLILTLCAPASRRASASRESQEPSAAQTTNDAAGHFAKDGLSFDYPAGWKLADRSTEAAQHLVLTREGSSALVMVIAHRDTVADLRQFEEARDAVTTPYVQNLARSLGLEKPPSWDEAQCLDLGERLPIARRFATGFRLSGTSNGQTTTGEVYAVALGGRFVNLVYVRSDKDDADGAQVWKSVLDTLKLDAPPSPAHATAEAPAANVVSGGVLNSKAVKKPEPRYPAAAKLAGQQGMVVVQLLVDEGGGVVDAKAVSGPALLKAAAVRAAEGATFKPVTICGHPVKVSGVVTYNFVLVRTYRVVP
jgi:TonB family protein